MAEEPPTKRLRSAAPSEAAAGEVAADEAAPGATDPAAAAAVLPLIPMPKAPARLALPVVERFVAASSPTVAASLDASEGDESSEEEPSGLDDESESDADAAAPAASASASSAAAAAAASKQIEMHKHWKMTHSKTAKRPYYFNSKDGTNTFDAPDITGWALMKSASSGFSYYF